MTPIGKAWQSTYSALNVNMKQELKDLIIRKGIYDCLCDPSESYKTGDYYGSIMDDIERIHDLIIEDCIRNVKEWERDSRNHISYMLKEHYEVSKDE